MRDKTILHVVLHTDFHRKKCEGILWIRQEFQDRCSHFNCTEETQDLEVPITNRNKSPDDSLRPEKILEMSQQDNWESNSTCCRPSASMNNSGPRPRYRRQSTWTHAPRQPSLLQWLHPSTRGARETSVQCLRSIRRIISASPMQQMHVEPDAYTKYR